MENTILNELKKNIGTPCVSVIMPTHPLTSEHNMDDIELKKIYSKAKDLVYAKCGKKNGGEEVLEKLKALSENLSLSSKDKGIGFFVSPNFSQLVSFPFSVREKIVVGDNFEVRDVIYLADSLITYYVLLINDKELKLFEGSGSVTR